MMYMDENLSRKLTLASLVGTIMIVLFHVPREVCGGAFHRWLVEYGCNTLPYLAVPMFFAISGFLLAGKCTEPGWYKAALKSRARTLLIPFLCVNAIYLPIMIGYHFIPGTEAYVRPTLGWLLYMIVRGMGLDPTNFPACNPLWYIRTLLLFVLVSPFIVSVLRRSRFSGVAFWLLLVVVVDVLQRFVFPGLPDIVGRVDRALISTTGLCFFVGGILYRIYGSQMNGVFHGAGIAGLIVASFVLNRLGVGWLWQIPGVAALWLLIPSVKIPQWIASMSFPIYAFHILVFFGLKLVVPRQLLMSGWGLALGIVLGIILPCLGVALAHKLFPRFLAFILGGR